MECAVLRRSPLGENSAKWREAFVVPFACANTWIQSQRMVKKSLINGKSRKRSYYRTKWWLKRADQFVAQNISLDSFHARDQPRH
jgi:hypothetical protein